jgi:UTP-glucose-1-phosphate uridylyltransferase
MTSPTLLVLAAGLGSRYGGLKQIDPVGPHGETIMDYSVYDALRAGFGKIVFVLRKQIEQPFKEAIGARFKERIAVEYVFQELDSLPPGFSVPSGRTKPWGTTHAILAAAGAIHEPFAVINADDFYGAESYRLLARHLRSGAISGAGSYAMAGYLLRNTLSDFGAVARGVCQVDSGGFLAGIVELTHIERDGFQVMNTGAAGHITQLTGNEVVSMNMWGFTPRIFGQLQEEFERFLAHNGSELKSESYLPSAINALVLSGRAQVQVLPTREAWFGVTHRADHPRVVESIGRLIRAGSYPERLWP